MAQQVDRVHVDVAETRGIRNYNQHRFVPRDQRCRARRSTDCKDRSGLIGAVDTTMGPALRLAGLVHRARNVLAKVPKNAQAEGTADYFGRSSTCPSRSCLAWRRSRARSSDRRVRKALVRRLSGKPLPSRLPCATGLAPYIDDSTDRCRSVVGRTCEGVWGALLTEAEILNRIISN